MKTFIKILILAFVPLLSNAQVFIDESKTYSIEKDYVFIPSLHFGYNIMQTKFLSVNNGLELERKFVLPEIYLGCQFLSNGFMIGFHYGVLQKTILLGGGFTIPFKSKKQKY